MLDGPGGDLPVYFVSDQIEQDEDRDDHAEGTEVGQIGCHRLLKMLKSGLVPDPPVSDHSTYAGDQQATGHEPSNRQLAGDLDGS